jgi:hypothetical protein
VDAPTQDELFLDAVDAIVLDALARIGDDPRARYAFLKSTDAPMWPIQSTSAAA